MPKNPDLEDANNTTSLPEAAEDEERRLNRIVATAPKKFEAKQESPQIAPPRGRFSAGAGTDDISQHIRHVDSWVIFTLTPSDSAQAVADLLIAWKAAEQEIPYPSAEFKILSYKNSSNIHGVLEISEHVDPFGGMRELNAPLRIAEKVMISIANHLLRQGYECPPR